MTTPALPKAQVLKRFFAALIDDWVFGGIIAVVTALVSAGWLELVAGPIYYSLQDWPLGGGTSVGRKMLDQVLVDRDGFEASYRTSFLRNGLRVLFWPLSCGIGFVVDAIMILTDEKGRTLEDRIMGTQVIDRAYLRHRELPGAAVAAQFVPSAGSAQQHVDPPAHSADGAAMGAPPGTPHSTFTPPRRGS